MIKTTVAMTSIRSKVMARRHGFAVSRRDHRKVAGATSVKMILRLFPTASIPGKF